MKKLLSYLLILICIPIAVLVIITPMNSYKQFIFAISILLCMVIMNFSKRRSVSVIMVFLSILMSARYIYFRATQTLVFSSEIEMILGIGLFVAEIYSFTMLLLGYLQTTFPLKREIVPLPEDERSWPTVDVYIPTYNEPLNVVRDTVLAAQCLDYPANKMRIYLLDDGNRQSFAAFAADAGVGYITRDNNEHAKAGNLNHAMQLTHGELICIFDCDHVATRIFLQATVGAFIKDPKLSLIQTPHHFYSPDPFERNLAQGENVPNEGEIFYGPVQQGNDNWNATFFCGSCAVIRRSALDEIDGFAVETVTEDAHTALKLQRLGWNTAFLAIPMAGGLATERLALHVIQRNRWARGMTQIFRLDNPLLGRGLSLAQRLCYLSSMLYFQFALPRIVFITAPLTYLLFNLKVIHASAILILAYVLPHLVLSNITGSRLSGRSRYAFWGDIYDTVLAFHLVIPTFVTMIMPTRGKFNVTDKGGLLDKDYFDFHIVRIHILVAGFIALGLVMGLFRFTQWGYPAYHPFVVAINIIWGFYSLFFMLGAIAVANEQHQTRTTTRLKITLPAIIHYASGILSTTTTVDLSMSGCCIKLEDEQHLTDPIEAIELELQSCQVELEAKTVLVAHGQAHLVFDELSTNQRRELVRIVLSRADAWVKTPRQRQNGFKSLLVLAKCIARVYWSMFRPQMYKAPKTTPKGLHPQTLSLEQGIK
ncbi:UDP-forming cellulose synthase catalytic subunit [Celerinatantimonas sp. MCCC 1A17872]|uniref:UDP-forming cellulose synthase catalytic subunit n=1 Tax=Celerinatantimonas sp. MCCC 1A17872 TaxID=3177514 RepID=UPI0038C9F87F